MRDHTFQRKLFPVYVHLRISYAGLCTLLRAVRELPSQKDIPQSCLSVCDIPDTLYPVFTFCAQQQQNTPVYDTLLAYVVSLRHDTVGMCDTVSGNNKTFHQAPLVRHICCYKSSCRNDRQDLLFPQSLKDTGAVSVLHRRILPARFTPVPVSCRPENKPQI